MIGRALLVAGMVGLVGFAFPAAASAGEQTLVGIVKAAPAGAKEAATVKVGGVVYKITKDAKGRKVASEAINQKVEIKGILADKNGARWITVISCKIVE